MKTGNCVVLIFLVVGVACISRKDAPPRLARDESALISTDAIGLNLGTLDFPRCDVDPTNCCDDPADCQKITDALSRARELRTRWIRLEISAGRDANYWATVISRLTTGTGISVLGALNNTLWAGGARDPDVCNDSSATDFGSRLATEWLDIATSYLQTLNTQVQHWELWNEANNVGVTDLCPSNYGLLLTTAANRWQDAGWNVTIGPSLITYGSATRGPDGYRTYDYLDHLFAHTQDVTDYRTAHGGNPPWVRIYNHAYACRSPTPFCGPPWDEPPSTYLTNQANEIRAAQPMPTPPIWFTELGFQANDPDPAFNQSSMLLASYDVVLNRGLGEKVFWYKLTDCGPHGNYGLLAGCSFDRTVPERDSYWKFQSLSTRSLDCHSMTPCKMSQPGSGCEAPGVECPAVRFDLGWPQTLHARTNGYDAPGCNGSVRYTVEGDINFPTGGTWIIYVMPGSCPATPQYSADYAVGLCGPPLLCGDYQCQSQLPNCDVFGAEVLPAVQLGAY